MASVRILSQKFLKSHYRAGKPTFFVEQYLNCAGINYTALGYLDMLCTLNSKNRKADPTFCVHLINFFESLKPGVTGLKYHTIRGGQHFKTGDPVSLRVWESIPYQSKQIIIAPDITLKKIWDFNIKKADYLINNKKINLTVLKTLAANDGLTADDFELWFAGAKNKDSKFSGQILCWNKQVDY